MNDNASNNRRIAKNAVFLYMRMLITIVVGLYTSRVILATLGVDDYGIYGVVGSIIAMAGFLNSSMAGATSRFITVELGSGDKDRLNRTFASAFTIHLGIALVVVVLAETVGLWFLNNKLVIPADRMTAAHWVYQFSILSTAIGITQVPYNACIIAHERMGVYAYVEIINSVLRLLIVYLLAIGNYDKLILYGALSVTVSIIVLTIYRIYCHRQFPECRTTPTLDKELLKPMLTFSGWNLYNHICQTTHNNGLNILLNLFGGVVVNAAASVTTTVSSAISGLCSNTFNAMRPQIIKSYAQGDIGKMQSIHDKSVSFSIILLGAISIPLFFEIDYVLYLWLGNPPKFTATFCRVALITNIFFLAKNIINTIIQATGNIKLMSLISSSFYIICLPFVYIAFKHNSQPQWAYYLQLASFILATVASISIAKKQVPSFCATKTIISFCSSILVLALASMAVGVIHIYLDQSFFRLTACCLISVIATATATYWLIINKQDRTAAINFLKKHLPQKANNR
ncbi:MAG: polysaccharide biosynthesis protein [Muribaculaceae bacterium]|nr:polysaccharide biosynthesis protein [Muribaculaceae bacterium]